MTDVPTAVVPDARADVSPVGDDRPAGERYFRHPGDVVRLVVWVIAAALLALFVEVATGTSSGLSSDLGDAASRISRGARELLLAVAVAVAAAATACKRDRDPPPAARGVQLLPPLAGKSFYRLDLGPLTPCTAGAPLVKTRYPSVHQVMSSVDAVHDSSTCEGPLTNPESSGAVGGVVSTGSVTVSVLLCADARPFESPAHITNEVVRPGYMSRVQV